MARINLLYACFGVAYINSRTCVCELWGSLCLKMVPGTFCIFFLVLSRTGEAVGITCLDLCKFPKLSRPICRLYSEPSCGWAQRWQHRSLYLIFVILYNQASNLSHFKSQCVVRNKQWSSIFKGKCFHSTSFKNSLSESHPRSRQVKCEEFYLLHTNHVVITLRNVCLERF